MGHQVIRQPDGRLAVFSTVVDDFVVYDADGTEVIGYFVEIAAHQAQRDAQHAVALVVAGRAREVYAQFTMTWEEAAALALPAEGAKDDG